MKPEIYEYYKFPRFTSGLQRCFAVDLSGMNAAVTGDSFAGHVVRLLGCQFSLGERLDRLEGLFQEVARGGKLVSNDGGRRRKRGRAGGTDADDGGARAGKRSKMSSDSSARFRVLVADMSADGERRQVLVASLNGVVPDENRLGGEASEADVRKAVSQLSVGQKSLLYILLLEGENSRVLRELSETQAQLRRSEMSVLHEKGRVAIKLNEMCETGALLREKTFLLDMEKENTQRAERDSAKARAAAKEAQEKLREIVEEAEATKSALERLGQSKERSEERLNNTISGLEETQTQVEMEHMDAMSRLKAECKERVARHDEQARAHCASELKKLKEAHEREILEWKGKADSAFRIADHAARMRTSQAREMLVNAVAEIKKEIATGNGLSDALVQLLDNAPLQLSLVAGLAIPNSHSNGARPRVAPRPQRTGASHPRGTAQRPSQQQVEYRPPSPVIYSGSD